MSEPRFVDLCNGAKLESAGSDHKQLQLADVSVEQWGYANLNIMNELTNNCEIADQAGYIKYTMNIVRLALNNVWSSVLLYDKEYRELQVE